MKPYTLILTISFLLFSLAGFAQSEGPYFPNQTENQPLSSCGTCAGGIWNNTYKVNAADGVYSDVALMPYLYCFQSACYRSRYLTVYDFGFAIPSNAVVDGIMLSLIGKSTMMASVMDCTVVLMKNNVFEGNNLASGSDWDTTAMVRIYGSMSELWGTTWTPQEVNDVFFGAFIKVYNPSNNNPSALVDAVTMTVFYSIGTQTYSQTSSPGAFHAVHDAGSENILVRFPSGERGKGYLRVLDGFGKLCFDKQVDLGTGTKEMIPASGLAPGIYFCTLTSPDHTFTSKILVTR
jgi:hypothetical protein